MISGVSRDEQVIDAFLVNLNVRNEHGIFAVVFDSSDHDILGSVQPSAEVAFHLFCFNLAPFVAGFLRNLPIFLSHLLILNDKGISAIGLENARLCLCVFDGIEENIQRSRDQARIFRIAHHGEGFAR